MELLDNPVREYAWGSRVAIARLQGRPAPTERPEAELWLGAHPDSPSALWRGAGSVPLTYAIAADPAGVLGEPVAQRFGQRLPFLLKVLAAGQPLSLQAHPDAAQAAAGYAAEEAAGIPQDSPERSYRDAFHKPELLVAVEEFDALCGFRDPAESARLLAALQTPALAPTVAALGADEAGQALREAVTGLMSLSEPDRKPLVDAVVAAARRHGDAGGALGSLGALAVELDGRYPGDIGVVVALLLNQVRLAPGEAVWMPAGNLHAYLRGTGIEIMAASDNVLRGGLTPKHVDVAELLRVLRFEVLPDPVLHPTPAADGLVTWSTPADEFVLHRAVLDGAVDSVGLPGSGPRIVLCISGEVRADDGIAELRLRGGQAGFAPAGRSVTLRGAGVVFQATTPL